MENSIKIGSKTINLVFLDNKRIKVKIINKDSDELELEIDETELNGIIEHLLFLNDKDEAELDYFKSCAVAGTKSIELNEEAFGALLFENDSKNLNLKNQNYAFNFDNKKIVEQSQVYIALPQKDINLIDIEKVQNACGEFMEVLGYELEIKDEPVYGSFFQKMMFFLKSPKTKYEIEQGYSKAKAALEIKYLNVPSAESTEKIANAAGNIISSLNGVDEAVLRLGALLLVKVQKDGKIQFFAETLSPELSLLLDKNPQIMNNPNTVYDLLNGIKNKNYFEEGDGINIQQTL